MFFIRKGKLLRLHDHLRSIQFEENRESNSVEVQRAYDEAQTYHDGKWIMFYPEDDSLFPDFMRLLEIKRKTNRKR